MTTIRADVAILGSGFGGSLTALLLDRVGLRPVVIDRGRHPRFAIGESSTPIADYVLGDLARTYGLPDLEPLTTYGTWQAAYPHVTCGLKRGFSYFRHEAGRPFVPSCGRENELLVAASSDDEHSDTHWLRSDVDAFFAREVESAGIPLFDQTEVSPVPNDDGWIVSGQRLGEPIEIRARFVVDGSGAAGALLRVWGISNRADELTTCSRAVYSHFENVRPWRDCLEQAVGGSEAHASERYLAEHPFCCDNAALHHVLEEGWMWQLRFNNGITSAGFVLEQDRHLIEAPQPAERQWSELLQCYPSIAAQFAEARIAAPPGKLLQTGRLQRLAARMAGANWALLPHTAGFIDPLHSTGIAQTLCGIERLVEILGEHWEKPSLPEELRRYEETLRREFALIDKLVGGCYQARRSHRLFAAFSMLYFAAATTYEHRRAERALPRQAAFLCADDEAFCRLVDALWRQLRAVGTSDAEVAAFERQVADAIRPYNRVGLCDPSARNMYRYTAAPVRGPRPL